jgi:hypothetical protein
LKGDATFLQRLLVDRTRSNGVKLVPFSEAHVQGFSHYLDARGVRRFYLPPFLRRTAKKGGGRCASLASILKELPDAAPHETLPV